MRELEKRLPNIFQVSIHSDLLSLASGSNRQFYCTRDIIYNKTRQTFLGFEMTSNSRDTSPLILHFTKPSNGSRKRQMFDPLRSLLMRVLAFISDRKLFVFGPFSYNQSGLTSSQHIYLK